MAPAAAHMPKRTDKLELGGRMAGVYFSREEIRGLAGKVARIGDLLSPKERTLLLAIFAAAAASAEPAAGDHGPSLPIPEVPRQEGEPGTGEQGSGDDEETELGDLQTQLLNAYIPGNSFDSPGRYSVFSKIHPADTEGGYGP